MIESGTYHMVYSLQRTAYSLQEASDYSRDYRYRLQHIRRDG